MKKRFNLGVIGVEILLLALLVVGLVVSVDQVQRRQQVGVKACMACVNCPDDHNNGGCASMPGAHHPDAPPKEGETQTTTSDPNWNQEAQRISDYNAQNSVGPAPSANTSTNETVTLTYKNADGVDVIATYDKLTNVLIGRSFGGEIPVGAIAGTPPPQAVVVRDPRACTISWCNYCGGFCLQDISGQGCRSEAVDLCGDPTKPWEQQLPPDQIGAVCKNADGSVCATANVGGREIQLYNTKVEGGTNFVLISKSSIGGSCPGQEYLGKCWVTASDSVVKDLVRTNRYQSLDSTTRTLIETKIKPDVESQGRITDYIQSQIDPEVAFYSAPPKLTTQEQAYANPIITKIKESQENVRLYISGSSEEVIARCRELTGSAHGECDNTEEEAREILAEGLNSSQIKDLNARRAEYIAEYNNFLTSNQALDLVKQRLSRGTLTEAQRENLERLEKSLSQNVIDQANLIERFLACESRECARLYEALSGQIPQENLQGLSEARQIALEQEVAGQRKLSETLVRAELEARLAAEATKPKVEKPQPNVTITSVCQGNTLATQTTQAVSQGGPSTFASTQQCDFGCSAGSCLSATPGQTAQIYTNVAPKLAQLYPEKSVVEIRDEIVRNPEKYADVMSNEIASVYNSTNCETLGEAECSSLIEKEYQKRLSELPSGNRFVTITETTKEAIRKQAEDFVKNQTLSIQGGSLESGDFAISAIENLNAGEKWSALFNAAPVTGVDFIPFFNIPSLFTRATAATLIFAPKSAETLVCGEESLFTMGKQLGDQYSPCFQSKKLDEAILRSCNLVGYETNLSAEQKACVQAEAVAVKYNVANLQEERTKDAVLTVLSAVSAGAAGRVFQAVATGALTSLEAVPAASQIIRIAAPSVIKAIPYVANVGGQITSDVGYAFAFADIYSQDAKNRADAISTLAETAPAGSREKEIWTAQAEQARLDYNEAYKAEIINGLVTAGASNVGFEALGGSIRGLGDAIRKTPFADTFFGKVLFNLEGFRAPKVIDVGAQLTDAQGRVWVIEPDSKKLTVSQLADEFSSDIEATVVLPLADGSKTFFKPKVADVASSPSKLPKGALLIVEATKGDFRLFKSDGLGGLVELNNKTGFIDAEVVEPVHPQTEQVSFLLNYGVVENVGAKVERPVSLDEIADVPQPINVVTDGNVIVFGKGEALPPNKVAFIALADGTSRAAFVDQGGKLWFLDKTMTNDELIELSLRFPNEGSVDGAVTTKTEITESVEVVAKLYQAAEEPAAEVVLTNANSSFGRGSRLDIEAGANGKVIIVINPEDVVSINNQPIIAGTLTLNKGDVFSLTEGDSTQIYKYVDRGEDSVKVEISSVPKETAQQTVQEAAEDLETQYRKNFKVFSITEESGIVGERGPSNRVAVSSVSPPNPDPERLVIFVDGFGQMNQKIATLPKSLASEFNAKTVSVSVLDIPQTYDAASFDTEARLALQALRNANLAEFPKEVVVVGYSDGSQAVLNLGAALRGAGVEKVTSTLVTGVSIVNVAESPAQFATNFVKEVVNIGLDIARGPFRPGVSTFDSLSSLGRVIDRVNPGKLVWELATGERGSPRVEQLEKIYQANPAFTSLKSGHDVIIIYPEGDLTTPLGKVLSSVKTELGKAGVKIPAGASEAEILQLYLKTLSGGRSEISVQILRDANHQTPTVNSEETAKTIKALIEKSAPSAPPRPVFDNSIPKESADSWAAAHPSGDSQEMAQFLVDNTTHIDQATFEKNLNVVVDGFNRDIQNRPYVVVLAGGEDSSNKWVYELVSSKLSRPPNDVIDFKSTKVYLNQNPKVSDIVIIDDASYTGAQLRTINADVTVYDRPTKKHLLIPYLSSEATDFVASAKVPRPNSPYEIKTYGSKPILSIEQMINNIPDAQKRQRFLDLYATMYPSYTPWLQFLTYFDHKIPDPKSFFEPIRNSGIIPETHEPYKVGYEEWISGQEARGRTPSKAVSAPQTETAAGGLERRSLLRQVLETLGLQYTDETGTHWKLPWQKAETVPLSELEAARQKYSRTLAGIPGRVYDMEALLTAPREPLAVEIGKSEIEFTNTAAQRNLFGHGFDKSGRAGLFSTMVDGLKGAGDAQPYFGKFDVVGGVAARGPYFVLIDPDVSVKLPSRFDTIPPENHQAYIVPTKSEKDILLSAISEAKDKGILTNEQAETITKKLFTYDEYVNSSPKATRKLSPEGLEKTALTTSENLYDILDIPPKASSQEIEALYQQRLRSLETSYPSPRQQLKAQDDIEAAKAILENPELKSAYDSQFKSTKNTVNRIIAKAPYGNILSLTLAAAILANQVSPDSYQNIKENIKAFLFANADQKTIIVAAIFDELFETLTDKSVDSNDAKALRFGAEVAWSRLSTGSYDQLLEDYEPATLTPTAPVPQTIPVFEEGKPQFVNPTYEPMPQEVLNEFLSIGGKSDARKFIANSFDFKYLIPEVKIDAETGARIIYYFLPPEIRNHPNSKFIIDYLAQNRFTKYGEALPEGVIAVVTHFPENSIAAVGPFVMTQGSGVHANQFWGVGNGDMYQGSDYPDKLFTEIFIQWRSVKKIPFVPTDRLESYDYTGQEFAQGTIRHGAVYLTVDKNGAWSLGEYPNIPANGDSVNLIFSFNEVDPATGTRIVKAPGNLVGSEVAKAALAGYEDFSTFGIAHVAPAPIFRYDPSSGQKDILVVAPYLYLYMPDLFRDLILSTPFPNGLVPNPQTTIVASGDLDFADTGNYTGLLGNGFASLPEAQTGEYPEDILQTPNPIALYIGLPQEIQPSP